MDTPNKDTICPIHHEQYVKLFSLFDEYECRSCFEEYHEHMISALEDNGKEFYDASGTDSISY